MPLALDEEAPPAVAVGCCLLYMPRNALSAFLARSLSSSSSCLSAFEMAMSFVRCRVLYD